LFEPSFLTIHPKENRRAAILYYLLINIKEFVRFSNGYDSHFVFSYSKTEPNHFFLPSWTIFTNRRAAILHYLLANIKEFSLNLTNKCEGERKFRDQDLLQNFYDQNNYSIITFSMKHY
jgi:hypothetical protein